MIEERIYINYIKSIIYRINIWYDIIIKYVYIHITFVIIRKEIVTVKQIVIYKFSVT